MLPINLRLDLRQNKNFFNQALSRRIGSLRFFWTTDENNKQSQQISRKNAGKQNSNHLSSTRFAIIVKKTFGNAPQRSKIKRLLRHAIIELYHDSPQLFTVSQSVVVLVQGRTQSQSDYKKTIEQFLQNQLEKRESN